MLLGRRWIEAQNAISAPYLTALPGREAARERLTRLWGCSEFAVRLCTRRPAMVQRLVEEVAADMQASLPEGATIELIRTRAEAITGRLNILLENGTYGLALVVALLFLFLNARTAFWVAAGIPVAMLTALAFMYAAGLTINMISLFALIITLGIVVDDAIVVGEHADFRARRLGEDPVTAAENAAKRMAAPVFAATLTTVIAFFGLVAIGGRFGSASAARSCASAWLSSPITSSRRCSRLCSSC